MAKTRNKWAEKNHIEWDVRKKLEKALASGMELQGNIFSEKLGPIEIDSAVYKWTSELREALWFSDSGLIAFFPSSSPLEKLSITTSGRQRNSAVGLNKTLMALQQVIDGTFEPPTKPAESISLIYDGNYLVNADDHSIRIKLRRGSLPKEIIHLFRSQGGSEKKILEREVPGFKPEAFRNWLLSLQKSFHCTKNAVKMVISREKGYIVITNRMKFL